MILSNVKLQEALDAGWVVIHPEPSPRSATLAACPFQTTSVDLRLSSEISFFRDGLPVSIDLQRGNFSELFGPNSETRTISTEQPYALAPGRLVLGKTLERVELPIRSDRPCFAARIEGKSSYARCGLLVHLTAPTIHAGFAGTITLEMINLGSIPILLYPGMPICQLILELVDGTPFRNDSQFQGQSQAGGVLPVT